MTPYTPHYIHFANETKRRKEEINFHIVSQQENAFLNDLYIHIYRLQSRHDPNKAMPNYIMHRRRVG